MKSMAKSVIYRIAAGVGVIIYGIFVFGRRAFRDVEIQAGDAFFLWYVAAFLVCVLLSSAFIDAIRVETKWHSAVKVALFIIIFLVAFIAFLVAVVFLESIRFGQLAG